ncbi:MAG: ABC transporter ATP-binding protein [Burkholderiaceae bacterium]
MADEQVRLRLTGISKSFPGVRANDKVDLVVKAGEIHAVLGENGAGKSTLMKIICGVYAPDEGTLQWEGETVQIASPVQAQQLGIAMVHQHFALFESLTVAENISLGLAGPMNLRQLSADIARVSEQYGLPVNPAQHVFSMSVGERQRVEIIRCLLQRPRLLIMDEPTSVLTPQAVRQLFKTLRQLADEGCSVVYISHKLDEVRELCHRATVLRHGRNAGTAVPAEVDTREIVQMMIGGELPTVSRDKRAPGEVRLAVHHLSRPRPNAFGVALNDISLALHAGEVLGIAGVSGNGQQELLRALSGEAPGGRDEARDTITLHGDAVSHLDAGQRRALGLGFVPEERLGRGAVPSMRLVENAPLTGWRLGMVSSLGLLNRGRCREFAEQCIQRFDVRGRGAEAPAQSLSGGNLQKFIVGREIMIGPQVMLLAQPTWGVDVGAATAIRQQVRDLAGQGVAVLVVSEELEELFEICDRLAVIFEGHLSPVIDIEDTSAEQIGLWMAGMWPSGPGELQAQRGNGRAQAGNGRIPSGNERGRAGDASRHSADGTAGPSTDATLGGH